MAFLIDEQIARARRAPRDPVQRVRRRSVRHLAAHLARAFTAARRSSTGATSACAPYGLEHVPARGRAMLVGNHSGGVAIDGAMVHRLDVLRDGSAAPRPGHGREVHQHGALHLAVDEPHRPVHRPARARRRASSRTSACSWSSPRARAARPSSTRSATRWCTSAPASCASRCKTKTPIVPFAFIGGGEAIPTVVNSYALGKLFGAPYVPDHAVPLRACRCRCGSRSTTASRMRLRGHRLRGRRGHRGLRRAGEGADRRAHRGRPRAHRSGELVLAVGSAHEGPHPRHLRQDRATSSPSGSSPTGTRSSASIAARGPTRPPAVEMHEVDIRKRAAEDVFRKHRPDAVIHMATVTHLVARSEERYRINLGGTRAVFDHCARLRRRSRSIFVGRHTYYGAAPDSPLYHSEDEPPMAVTTFPELADLVAADLYAATALWRIPELVHQRPAHLLHARPDRARARSRRSSAGRACRSSSASIRSSSSCTSSDVAARDRARAREAAPRRLQRRRAAAGAALGARPRDRAEAPSPCPSSSSRAARALRPAAAAAGRAHPHQVPGGRRRARVPRGDGLHLEMDEAAACASSRTRIRSPPPPRAHDAAVPRSRPARPRETKPRRDGGHRAAPALAVRVGQRSAGAGAIRRRSSRA